MVCKELEVEGIDREMDLSSTYVKQNFTISIHVTNYFPPVFLNHRYQIDLKLL